MNITLNLSELNFATGCFWIGAGIAVGCYLIAYAIYETKD
jgi:hypothetical protein